MKYFSTFIAILGLFLVTSCSVKSDKSEQSATQSETHKTQATVTHLNTQQFAEKMASLQDVQIVDVRTPGEISEGKIMGAIEMDYSSGELSQRIEELDKEKPVMVYCRSGGRSSASAAILQKAGFKHIYNLKGAGYNQLSKVVK